MTTALEVIDAEYDSRAEWCDCLCGMGGFVAVFLCARAAFGRFCVT